MSNFKEKVDAGVYTTVKGYKPVRSDDPHENECLICHMSETAHQVLKAITCEDFK